MWGLGHSPKAGRRDASPDPLSWGKGGGDRENPLAVYFLKTTFSTDVIIKINIKRSVSQW